MSTHTAKTARRSTKTARRTVKKAAKSVRVTAKKAAKSARQSVTKAGKTAARAPSAVKPTNKLAKMLRTASPPMQPIAAHELPIKAHKYRIGEMVYFTSPTFGRAAATGSYTVVKLLPSEGDDYQYRIKSSGEAFERVAKESQLDRA
jgi:hypothetical protein